MYLEQNNSHHRRLGRPGRQLVDDRGRRGAVFLVAWVALVLVPLVISRGKIDYYLLPLYPAVSLLIGRFFVAVPWRRRELPSLKSFRGEVEAHTEGRCPAGKFKALIQ